MRKGLFVLLIAVVAVFAEYNGCGYVPYLRDNIEKCVSSSVNSPEACNPALNTMNQRSLIFTNTMCSAYWPYPVDGYDHYKTLLFDLVDDEIDSIADIWYKFNSVRTSVPAVPISVNEKSFGIVPIKGTLGNSADKHIDFGGDYDNTSLVFAAAYALTKAAFSATQDETLIVSPMYLNDCILDNFQERNEGIKLSVFMDRVIDRNVATIAHYDNVAGVTCLSVAKFPKIAFEYAAVADANKGGLIELTDAYVPLVVVAIDLYSLRTLSHTTSVQVPLCIPSDEPSVYAVLNSYKVNAYWEIVTNLLPSMPIDLHLAMDLSETSANTGAIAAYAIGVRAVPLVLTPAEQLALGFTDIALTAGNCNFASTETWNFAGLGLTSLTIGDNCNNPFVRNINITGNPNIRLMVLNNALCQTIKFFGLKVTQSISIGSGNFNNNCPDSTHNNLDLSIPFSIDSSPSLISIEIHENSCNGYVEFNLESNPILRNLQIGTSSNHANMFNGLTSFTINSSHLLKHVGLYVENSFTNVVSFVITSTAMSIGSSTCFEASNPGEAKMSILSSFGACTNFQFEKIFCVHTIDITLLNSFNLAATFSISGHNAPTLNTLTFVAHTSLNAAALVIIQNLNYLKTLNVNLINSMKTTVASAELSLGPTLTNVLALNFVATNSGDTVGVVSFKGLSKLTNFELVGTNSFNAVNKINLWNNGALYTTCTYTFKNANNFLTGPTSGTPTIAFAGTNNIATVFDPTPAGITPFAYYTSITGTSHVGLQQAICPFMLMSPAHPKCI